MNLEVVAEVVLAEADGAVMALPKHAVLAALAGHPRLVVDGEVVAALLVLGAPAPLPGKAGRVGGWGDDSLIIVRLDAEYFIPVARHRVRLASYQSPEEHVVTLSGHLS